MRVQLYHAYSGVLTTEALIGTDVTAAVTIYVTASVTVTQSSLNVAGSLWVWTRWNTTSRSVSSRSTCGTRRASYVTLMERCMHVLWQLELASLIDW